MKELRIDYQKLMTRDLVAMEFVLKQSLRSKGFDFSKPIIVWDDLVNDQKVYQQKEDK